VVPAVFCAGRPHVVTVFPASPPLAPGPFDPEWGVHFDPFAPVNVFGGALGTALGTLVVGALLVAFFPDVARRTTERVRDRPGESFAWKLFAFIAVLVLAVLLVVTIVGILVAVPLLLVVGLLAIVGDAVAFLAVGRALAAEFWPPAEDATSSEWTRPLLLGAGAAGGLSLVPGVGTLVAFLVGVAGFGAVVAELLDAR